MEGNTFEKVNLTSSMPLSESPPHSPTEPQPISYSGIPPFVLKTFQLVSDPLTDEIVSWSENGESFMLLKPNEFSNDVLPKYFKHNNLSSFIRQLNTYDFHKMDGKKVWEFHHSQGLFRKGKPDLLKQILRKKPATNSVGSPKGLKVCLPSIQTLVPSHMAPVGISTGMPVQQALFSPPFGSMGDLHNIVDAHVIKKEGGLKRMFSLQDAADKEEVASTHMDTDNHLVKKLKSIQESANTKIKLNIGGFSFVTSKATLLSIPGTLFTVMFDGLHKIEPDENGEYFLDRNPWYFERILDYFRTGQLLMEDLSTAEQKQMKEELDFFHIKIDQ